MKSYRTVDEVLSDRRKGTKLSDIVENILHSPYVLEQIENPFDIVYDLYPEDYLDASTEAWRELPVELQIKYSSTYQRWYARLSGYVNIEGYFELIPGVDMAMMLIPPMRKLMWTFAYARPKFVLFKDPFWMGKYEVTQREWLSVMGGNPSIFVGADLPVDNVQLRACRMFCKQTGMRVPTEHEWEMACCAGTTSEWSFGDNHKDLEHYAWYSNNSEATTHPVGQKKANAWGLHDMHGNIKELCENVRVSGRLMQMRRGGCWYLDAIPCRSEVRDIIEVSSVAMDMGFRAVRHIVDRRD